MTVRWKDFLAGTAGGFSAKVLDYPFDTVKVILQTQNSLSSSSSTPTPTSIGVHSSTISTMPNYIRSTTTPNTTPQQQNVYRGAIHCLQHTIKTRGFFSLYKGMSSPLLGSMAENAVLFLCYGEIKRLLGERPGQELSLLQLAMAGGAAGAVGAVALNPFEVIKGKRKYIYILYPFFGNISHVSVLSFPKAQCKCK